MATSLLEAPVEILPDLGDFRQAIEATVAFSFKITVGRRRHVVTGSGLHFEDLCPGTGAALARYLARNKESALAHLLYDICLELTSAGTSLNVKISDDLGTIVASETSEQWYVGPEARRTLRGLI